MTAITWAYQSVDIQIRPNIGVDETFTLCVKKWKKGVLHLFPVFSSAHRSCGSIYVKPQVPASPHPNAGLLQPDCYMTALKLYLASQYIFTAALDRQVFSALQNPTFGHVLYLPVLTCIHISVSLLLFVPVSFRLSQWTPELPLLPLLTDC